MNALKMNRKEVHVDHLMMLKPYIPSIYYGADFTTIWLKNLKSLIASVS